jgi:hypothetical protein
MSNDREILSINRKALTINLDDRFFGSFAEIGGGQEVARNFFQAGGASGTVAKTISAYDKRFSDALYCSEQSLKRYVSLDRLELMLRIEYNEIITLLKQSRDPKTCFFAFANTVSTLNYYKNNISHGWIGVDFQLNPDDPPNRVIMHVKLHENDNLLQQYTLGAFGVNLLYACFYFWQWPNTFLQSLLDNLSTDRIEITMIRMTGPQLGYVDNRLLAVQLVKNDMTRAIIFNRHGEVQEPGDLLYKKNVLAFRGSFRPITYVGVDMLKTSFSIFKRDEDYDKENTLALCEITLNNLLDEGQFDERDFLDRVDLLNGIGQNVMVSNFREFYKLVNYMSQFRIIKLRLVIGILTFQKVIDEKYYKQLKGGILEAFGMLFHENVKMYIYPALDEEGSLITIHTIGVPEKNHHLFQPLLANRIILDVPNVNVKYLDIYSPQVLQQIQDGHIIWETQVPRFVADTIKKKQLFGYTAGNHHL